MKLKGTIKIEKRTSKNTGNAYRCIVFTDEYGKEMLITADMQAVNNFAANLLELIMQGEEDET